MNIYKKKCPNLNDNPKCKKVQVYSTKYQMVIAKKENRLCRNCSKTGKLHPLYGSTRKFSEEHKKKLRENHKGMLGKCHTNETKNKQQIKANGRWTLQWFIKKYGEILGKVLYKQRNEQMSKDRIGCKNHFYKKVHSEETKRKLRLKRLKSIETNFGQVMPNYNPNSIPIIEQYGKEYGYNFQHAENGGEVCIDGYFPDGVDLDRKVIIEIDEKRHFNTDGTYKQKDIDRQKYLEKIGYKVIRIKI